MSIMIICDGCGNRIEAGPVDEPYIEVNHRRTHQDIGSPGDVAAVLVPNPDWPPAGTFHAWCFPGAAGT